MKNLFPQTDGYNFPPKKSSNIIVPHSDNCKAIKWVKEGDAPFEWNVLHLLPVNCNEDGELVTMEQIAETGHAEIWFMLLCADHDCKGRKVISSKSLATL